MSTITAPQWAVSHPAWLRLEDQLSWYDRRSVHCQKLYKWLRLLQFVLAVSISITSHIDSYVGKWLISLAGGLIAIIEATQHMNQYSTLWVTYRSTAERLKHEKYLFLAAAGPYRNMTDAERLMVLAERVEEHVSTEHANWFNETGRALQASRRESSPGRTE